MKIPVIDAVCQVGPADEPNSQGEKNKIMPRDKFTTSQSLTLDHSSMTPSGDQAGVFTNTPLADGVNAMICIKPSVVLTQPAGRCARPTRAFTSCYARRGHHFRRVNAITLRGAWRRTSPSCRSY